MDPIELTPELSARLTELNRQVVLADECGEPLGVFIPMSTYREWLARVAIPFSQEEIARRRGETGGSSLQEFWAKLPGLEDSPGALLPSPKGLQNPVSPLDPRLD